MKKAFILLVSLGLFALFACNNDTHLRTEKVIDADPPPEEPEEIHELFSLPPGKEVSFYSLSGAIDPVGTNIINDFDGDGIENIKETTTNVWVADYPAIETNIAPPVTMQIEILYASNTQTMEYTTDITSDDVVRNIDKSNEEVHRNELNLRTINYMDIQEKSNSTTNTRQASASASGMFKGFGASVSGSTGTTKTYTDKYVKHDVKWTDVPFKNNLNRTGWSVKSDESAKEARQLRREIRSTTNNSYQVKPNAGYVRAALYINNDSVNMPVKLRDILCSLMLEAPDGQLIPLQSFRLRNDDYSIFEVELYGQSTFGPYVIELKDLNTVEIKNALEKGYNPKIFIVDYEMHHVEDSNYRSALSSSFSGDNLKIIEENAKGRTAGVKIVGPGFREFYRVAAFDTDGEEGRIGTTGTNVSPGVPLEKALKRISFSGSAFEFANYVLDFSDPEAGVINKRFWVRSIKRIRDIETIVPLAEGVTPILEADGTYTYVVKPFSQWSDDDLANFKVWVVYDKGKYYTHAADYTIGGISQQYTYTDAGGNTVSVPMLSSLRSIVWPGDHYDIVYLDIEENEGLANDYGKNPLETGQSLSMNTRWNTRQLGDYAFDPETKAVFLGDAGLGDTVEFSIKLTGTRYLNPSFGIPRTEGDKLVYNAFSYNWRTSTRRFSPTEAVDFELSMALGGRHSDWFNLLDPDGRSPYSAYKDKVEVVDTSWDYINQVFTVKLKIAGEIDGVPDDGSVKLFIRPALNNAYRETVWPLAYGDIKKFRGAVATYAPAGSLSLGLGYCAGTPAIGDTMYLSQNGTIISRTIAGYSLSSDGLYYSIELTSPLTGDLHAGEQVYVNLGTGDRPTGPVIELYETAGFYPEWNLEYDVFPADELNGYVPLLVSDGDLNSPAKYLGFNTGYIPANWTGGNNYFNPYWNSWSDSIKFLEYMELIRNPIIMTNTGKYLWLGPTRLSMGASDFLASTTNTNIQTGPQVAMYGDRALMVWESNDNGSNYDIRGRVFDAVSGLPVGNDFLVSTTNANVQSLPRVSMYGDRALVVWETKDNGSNYDIRGRIVDMVSGLPLGNDFLVSTTNANNQSFPQVKIYGNQALVVWVNLVGDLVGNIRGRVVDMVSGLPLGSDFLISPSNTVITSVAPLVDVYDDRALVAWQAGDGGSMNIPRYIRGRIIDMAAGLPVGNDFLVSLTSEIMIYQELAINGNRGVVVWVSSVTNPTNIRCRFVDMTSDLPVGEEYLLGTHNPNYSPLPRIQVGVYGDRALVVWESSVDGGNHDVRGQILDMFNCVPVGNTILISTSNTNAQVLPKVAVDGDRALVVWESNDNNYNYDIRGRVLDMVSGSLFGNDFLVSTTNFSEQNTAEVSVFGDQALVVWKSNDNGSNYDIRARSLYLGDPDHGLNNFMVSPLLERDYNVSARIVE